MESKRSRLPPSEGASKLCTSRVQSGGRVRLPRRGAVPPVAVVRQTYSAIAAAAYFPFSPHSIPLRSHPGSPARSLAPSFGGPGALAPSPHSVASEAAIRHLDRSGAPAAWWAFIGDVFSAARMPRSLSTAENQPRPPADDICKENSELLVCRTNNQYLVALGEIAQTDNPQVDT